MTSCGPFHIYSLILDHLPQLCKTFLKFSLEYPSNIRVTLSVFNRGVGEAQSRFSSVISGTWN